MHAVHADGTITVLHGTTEANAALIRERGFAPSDPLAMTRMVSDYLGVELSLLWDSMELQFARGRSDLDRCFFTANHEVAAQYRIPEVVQDAFGAAWRLRFGSWDENSTPRENHARRDQWIAQKAPRLLGPGAVLEVRLPWEVIGAHAFGRVVALHEWLEWGEAASDLNSFSLPISALPHPWYRQA